MKLHSFYNNFFIVLPDSTSECVGDFSYLVNENFSDTPKSLVEVGYDEADTTGMLV